MSERVLAIRKVDDVLGTVRYCPDPEAPGVHDVVETLRYAAKCLELHGEREAISRIDNLIARLEG